MQELHDQVYDPLLDLISRLQLLEFMGGDHAVVNDARASFGKQADPYTLTDRDKSLINYLWKHEHTSPFRSTIFKFRVKAPLFVARQWLKHIVASSHCDEQFTWNELSLRYTNMSGRLEFYTPMVFFSQSEDNKQGSGEPLEGDALDLVRNVYADSLRYAKRDYEKLISNGLAKEQARGVLPNSVYVTWVWTVSFQALVHFIQLRLGEGAQTEIVQYAECLKQILKEQCPVLFNVVFPGN